MFPARNVERENCAQSPGRFENMLYQRRVSGGGCGGESSESGCSKPEAETTVENTRTTTSKKKNCFAIRMPECEVIRYSIINDLGRCKRGIPLNPPFICVQTGNKGGSASRHPQKALFDEPDDCEDDDEDAGADEDIILKLIHYRLPLISD